MTDISQDKVLVQIGDTVIELTGQVKEKFESDRQAINAELETQALELQGKIKSRESALAKLGALGLTEAEIQAL